MGRGEWLDMTTMIPQVCSFSVVVQIVQLYYRGLDEVGMWGVGIGV